MEKEIVVYVGSSRLVAVEGIAGSGEPKVLRAAGKKDPEGFEKGLVTNLEKASTAISGLIETLYPGKTSLPVYAVLGNAKLKTYGYSSSQYYQGMPRAVSSHDIRAVVNQTRSVATLPLSEFVLQAIPESFLVNDMNDVRNPLGLETRRLGVNLKIFTMNFEDFKNIARAFESADIEVEGYFPKTLTISEAVLTDQEKEEGTLLADISEDHLHLVVWKNGDLVDTKVLDLGGAALTSEIAECWQIGIQDAEKVKQRYGALDLDPKFGDELIPLIERNGRANRQIQRREFQEAFLEQSRNWMAKILAESDRFVQEQKLAHPHLVFTGGITVLDGFLEFLQKQFSRDARIGLARKIEAPNEFLVNPSLTPALGMIRWLSLQESGRRQLLAPSGLLQKTVASARDWFSSYF